jgi:hypothetical protein
VPAGDCVGATFAGMIASSAGWSAQTVRVEVAAGLAYWSLLAGPLLSPVEPVDHFLRHLRFGRNAAESTTKSYAGHLKRFELWRVAAGMSWEQAARDIARYLIHLRTTPRKHPGRGPATLRASCLRPAEFERAVAVSPLLCRLGGRGPSGRYRRMVRNDCAELRKLRVHELASAATGILSGRLPADEVVVHLQRQVDELRVALHSAEADLSAARTLNQRLLIENTKLLSP